MSRPVSVKTPASGSATEPLTRDEARAPGAAPLTPHDVAAVSGAGLPGTPVGVPSVRGLRLISAARVVVVTVFAAVGSAWPGSADGTRTLAFLVALVWLPWTLVVFITSDAPYRRFRRYGGWLGDLAALGTVIVLAPSLAPPARYLIAVVLVVALYTSPELPFTVPLAACIAVGVGASLAHPTRAVAAVHLPIFVLLLVTVAAVWRALVRRDQEAARVATWLRDRADTIVDHMPEPVVLTDAFGHVLRWNPVAGAALGLQAAGDHQCAASLGLHLGERSLDCSTGCALLSLVGTGVDRSVEVWRPLPDGERQPLLASVTPVVDRSGRLSEVVHCFRDITRLKEADEAKTLFLATASHELKTPLTVIRGFAEMLHADRLPDEESRRRAFEAIHLRSVELARVVDRLLLSSRIDAGRLSVKLEELDVVELVAGRAAGFESSTGRIVSVSVEGEPSTALADNNALATVVDHLIDNAIKYSPDGPPVGLVVRAVVGGVQLDVHDTGIGMTEEQAEHCFDKFWQADSGDRRRFGGTGIGLYIVRSLVESMGGRISVDSRVGVGTTFRLTLGQVGHIIPEQRAPIAAPERSIIREFMRQIGVPGEDRP